MIHGSQGVEQCVPCKPRVIADDRIDAVIHNGRDITGLTREIANIAHAKLNELFGCYPSEAGANSKVSHEPNNWIDRVLQEQCATIMILRELHDRIINL